MTTRRAVIAGAVACFVLVRLSGAEARRFDYSADAMGGTFSIAVHAGSRTRAEAASTAAFVELRRLDRMLSNYRPESEWSEVNRHAADRPVRVPRELFEVVAASLGYSRLSEGAFDITVGPLVKAWGFHGADGAMTSPEAIRQAAALVGYRHVLLDAKRRTIRFARAGVELDPGGIGKGYAVDRMVSVLEEHGLDRVLVSASGSTLRATSPPPGQAGWAVSFGGPAAHVAEGRILLKQMSLSTSGSTVRFFRLDGKRYGHVIDPRTGAPTPNVLSAVAAPRAIDSEAWTKAVLVNGRDWAARHTPGGWRAFLCEGEQPSSCGWIPVLR